MIDEETKKQEKKERAAQLIEEGGEINVLDAEELELDSKEIEASLNEVSSAITESDPSTADILQMARHI